ncbi:MAG: hypothetical protein JO100_17385 [Pseudonocardia sp.]|nr:hypothetical protein [Pseudonocardia sp.]
MSLLAATSGDGARGLLALALVFGIGYFLLFFFFEKARVGAWVLLAAILVGILVATGR